MVRASRSRASSCSKPEFGNCRIPGACAGTWAASTSPSSPIRSEAAAVLVEAAKLPNAPYWLESLAGKFLMGDDRQASRAIWRRQYELGEGVMRDNAAYHLQVLDALDTRDALRERVERFREARGRVPRELGELVASGLIRELPRDPSGAAFAYNPETGNVTIARESRLWRSKYE